MAVNPGINTIVGFNVNSATPIDNRMVVADAAALAALVSPYVGLVTYQVNTGVSYIYNGSTWIDEKVGLVSATSSGGVTYSIPYWSSPTTQASSNIYLSLSSGKPVVGVNLGNSSYGGVLVDGTGTGSYSRETFQVNSPLWATNPSAVSAPFVIHNSGLGNILGFNWYYGLIANGLTGEHAFDASRYSAKISFHGTASGTMSGKMAFAFQKPSGSFADTLVLDYDSTTINNEIRNTHNIGGTAISQPSIASGEYTPTGWTGGSASSWSTVILSQPDIHPFQWMRVGNVVSVSGRVDIEMYTQSSAIFNFTLPVPTLIGATSRGVSGTAHALKLSGEASSATFSYGGVVTYDSDGVSPSIIASYASLRFYGNDTTQKLSWYVNFTYLVVDDN